MDQLLRIILLRHQLYGPEQYSFIVWWLCAIDAHAVLTGGGDGKFVETLLRHNMIPQTIEKRPRNGSMDSFPSFTGDIIPAPSPLKFHRNIALQAAKLGRLGRDFRLEVLQQETAVMSDEQVYIRQQRLNQAQNSLKQTWDAYFPSFQAMGYTNDRVPVKDRGIFEHVSFNHLP